MSILGADVSGWQGPTLNYSGLDFVYVKITQGTYVANPNHDAQVAHARELGLIVGHYHFPAWGDPRAEARAFWSAAAAQPGDFLVLDIENSVYTPWPADPVSWCCAFEDELKSLSGIWAMDYAGPNVRNGWDWSPLAARGGGLVDPEYNPVGPGSPAPWAAVAMWQNADTNVTGGDSDVFYGDRATLLRYGIPGITPESTPTVKDWFDMATIEELDAVVNKRVREAIQEQFTDAEGTPTSLKDVTFILRSLVHDVPNQVFKHEVPRQGKNVSGMTSLDGVVANFDQSRIDTIAAMSAAEIASAVPANLAQQVIDALAAKLTTK